MPPPLNSPLSLLAQARASLDEAARAEPAGERYSLAHLAALRVAAALVAGRARPARARARPVNAWVLLTAVAPEFADWAAYFAAGAAARAAVEAGARNAVSQRDADDQLRAAGEFLALAEQSIGVLTARLAS